MRGSITGTYGMTMHVNDLHRGVKFWESVGLKPLLITEDAAAFAVPNSGPITLHKWQSACQTSGGRPPGTVSGLMLATDDAAAACARVAEAGGKVLAPPFPAPPGGFWSVVADPDGNEFMLCQP